MTKRSALSRGRFSKDISRPLVRLHDLGDSDPIAGGIVRMAPAVVQHELLLIPVVVAGVVRISLKRSGRVVTRGLVGYQDVLDVVLLGICRLDDADTHVLVVVRRSRCLVGSGAGQRIVGSDLKFNDIIGKAGQALAKRWQKVLLASLDTYRPAAQEQLADLGKSYDLDVLPIIPDQKPLQIT